MTVNEPMLIENEGEHESRSGDGAKRTARPWADYTKRTLGGVLCLAAVLKAVSAFSSPLEGLNAILALAGSCVEVVIGVALILRFRPSISLPAAGLLFVLLAGVSWIGTVRGVASCGCFGAVPMPPWVLLVFDAGAAIALLWEPLTSAAGALTLKQPVALAAACIVIFVVGLAAGSILYPRLGAVTSVLTREAIATASTVVIERSNLKPGRPFPLLPYFHIDADLSRGDWKIILARAGCRKCERRLRGGDCKPDGLERVAVVLTEEKKGWALDKECEAILGRLSQDKTWSFDAPLTFWLKDGRLLKLR